MKFYWIDLTDNEVFESEERLELYHRRYPDARRNKILKVVDARELEHTDAAARLEIASRDEIIRNLKTEPAVDALVDRFLAWPVPTSCCPDNLDADGRMRPGGSGTNLLSAAEAKQMFEFVLRKQR